MEQEAKLLLFKRLDECLKSHTRNMFLSNAQPDMKDIYELQQLAELHYHLKVSHPFTPAEVEALLSFKDPLNVARWCWEENTHAHSFPICELLPEATQVGGGGNYLHYTVPPEALSDARFAAMLTEAEKYLGYPYVWGGSSPSTSFDCSGYVSWVVNHSGWDFGRLTADGLLHKCTPVTAADAKPGDLIFFQGTYNTSGASHVGIYVGDGMMIHCGNPISYASINTNYWQSHFYTFGRLP